MNQPFSCIAHLEQFCECYLVFHADYDEDLYDDILETLKKQCSASSLKDTVELSVLYERDNAFLLVS